MRRSLLLPLMLALSACGSGSATFDKMAGATWANGPDRCATQFTTFDHRMIRWHHPDGTVDFGKIVVIGDAARDEVMLTVEPSDQIKAFGGEHPESKPLPKAVTMGFRLRGDHLQLLAMASSYREEVLKPEDEEYRLFDLVKCPVTT